MRIAVITLYHTKISYVMEERSTKTCGCEQKGTRKGGRYGGCTSMDGEDFLVT